MSHLIIIAGSNGAGKTTAAPSILKNSLNVDDFVNADIIAQGLCAFQPEKVAIQAGKIMLKRIYSLADEKANFAFETTLSGKNFAVWINNLKKEGYKFHLIFLWLESADLAVLRVKERVKFGGHFIPEETIRRRYVAGLKNFFNLYVDLADTWQFYDNSDVEKLSLIASGSNGKEKLLVINKEIWDKLVDNYYER